MPQRNFAFRSSIFFLFLFFGMGMQLPFLPLWLKDRGLSAPDIAIILAAQIAIRLISAPVGTFLADRAGNRLWLIQWGTVACLCGYLLLCIVQGFWLILVASLLAGAFFALIVPLMENFSVEGAAHFGLDYGRMRLWGTVSFILGNIVAGGLLEFIAISNVVYMITAAHVLLALAAVFLPPDPTSNTARHSEALPGITEVWRLLCTPAFLVFMSAISLGQASHAVYYGFGSLHWASLGYSEAVIGLLWLTGGSAEVVAFAVSGKAARSAGPILVILVGTAGGAVRWLVTATDPVIGILFVIQTFHAFSFTLTHLGTMHFIQQSVPPALRNTAQGLYAALAGGLVMGVATYFSGPLYRDFGGSAYLAMAMLSAAGACLALLLFRIIPKAPKAAGTS